MLLKRWMLTKRVSLKGLYQSAKVLNIEPATLHSLFIENRSKRNVPLKRSKDRFRIFTIFFYLGG